MVRLSPESPRPPWMRPRIESGSCPQMDLKKSAFILENPRLLFVAVQAAACERAARIAFSTSRAASAITVPGPNTAATPARFRNS